MHLPLKTEDNSPGALHMVQYRNHVTKPRFAMLRAQGEAALDCIKVKPTPLSLGAA